jgi:hypothetical protein
MAKAGMIRVELVFTDGRDERFAALCAELDAYLDELVGGEKQRALYNRYNTLETVNDVALILEDGRAVACGGYKEYAPGTAEIKRVFTKPECRGRGYGRAVMGALEQRARAQGYARLILETGRILQAAFRIYTSLGFRVTPNYGPYCCMQDSICMEKMIAPGP